MKLPFPPQNEKAPEIILTKESLAFIRAWVVENSATMPDAIRPFILAMLDMCEDAQVLLKNNKKLVDLLRQHMGFVPTKERDGKSKTDNHSDEWTKQGENSLLEKLRKAREKWREYKKNKPKKKKNSVVKRNAADAQSDDTESPEEPESPTPPRATDEAMFMLPAAQTENKTEDRTVDRDTLPVGLGTLSSSWKQRTRYDVSLLLTIIGYNVETVQSPETGFSKTATVDAGPARFKITWNGMAQIVLLVVGMGIPMVRLASCLGASVKYFNPSRIYRICLYVAQALLAIYLEIFKLLAQCDILSGDDTHNSVLHMRVDNPPVSKEELEENKKRLATSKAENHPQKIDLLLEAEEVLGTQMPTKNGDGLKKSIFTTVVIGQRPILGPSATLVFYHSERKSFGDVLGKILARRDVDPDFQHKRLVVQSDLSSSNIPNPLPVNLSVDFIGCGAHARRPFWRFRDNSDPLVGYHCYTMLLLFDRVFDSDRDARAIGDEKIILRARQIEQKPLWDEIKRQAHAMRDDLAPNADMIKAANYIINNFGKMTHYLSDPKLRPDNNWAERLLRYEKVMLDNSKFRVSKRGRLAYDILRTILATCNAAGVAPFPYLVHVLKSQVGARKNPFDYTPYAYASKKK